MDEITRALCIATTMKSCAKLASKGSWFQLGDAIITDGTFDIHPGDTDGYGGPMVCESVTREDALFFQASQPRHIIDVVDAFELVVRELKALKARMGDHRDALMHTRNANEGAVERLNQVLKGS